MPTFDVVAFSQQETDRQTVFAQAGKGYSKSCLYKQETDRRYSDKQKIDKKTVLVQVRNGQE